MSFEFSTGLVRMVVRDSTRTFLHIMLLGHFLLPRRKNETSLHNRNIVRVPAYYYQNVRARLSNLAQTTLDPLKSI